MNKKIYACIIFSFVVSFGLLLLTQNYFQEEPVPNGSEFYLQDFSSENELIFLNKLISFFALISECDGPSVG